MIERPLCVSARVAGQLAAEPVGLCAPLGMQPEHPLCLERLWEGCLAPTTCTWRQPQQLRSGPKCRAAPGGGAGVRRSNGLADFLQAEPVLDVL